MLPVSLLTDIAQFAFNDKAEFERAAQTFRKSLQGTVPTEEVIEDFEMDYIFSRKHSVYGKTFVRLFVECFEEAFGKEWSKHIMGLNENFEGYFEVVSVEKDHLLVTDLVIGDTLKIQELPADYNARKGDIITGRVFKWRGDYYFGSLGVYEGEASRETRALTKEVKRVCKEATLSYAEYFGDTEVIFENREQLEKDFNEFALWFFTNKAPPGIVKGRDVKLLGFEELEGKKEIGLLIDYTTGQRIIPEYGYAVKLISGKWEEVPEYGKIAKSLLYKDKIPSHFVRRLIKRNPHSSVRLYSEFFPVESVQDVIELFARHRRDWGQKPRRQSIFLER